MSADDELAGLLEALVNRVSHPRGRALSFLAKSGMTVDQAILLHHASVEPGATPTRLALAMGASLPSMSQMIERLAAQGLVRRAEHPDDRRKRTVEPTPKARRFLERFRAVRVEEFGLAAEGLTPATRKLLATAIRQALRELG